MRPEQDTQISAPSPLLVFICTANACRSAIAQAIAADAAHRRGVPLRVASAGTRALPGLSAATVAQTTLSEIGLSLEQHRSQPANGNLIADASLVVTMTDDQRDVLQMAFKKDADKIVSFDEVTQLGDIPDPVGGDPEEVRAVRDKLLLGMPMIFATLSARNPALARETKGS